MVKQRKCKDCGIEFPFTPRKVRCIDCYKKYTNWTKPTETEVKFIPDD